MSPAGIAIAVSDGAGSAPRGDEGAKIAVNAALGALEACPETLDVAVRASRRALAAKSDSDGSDVRDFACTLIVLRAAGGRVEAAQVGDGAVVVRKDTGELKLMSATSRGEFINETTFLTSDDAVNAVHTSAEDDVADIAVLTDGLQMVGLCYPSLEPFAPFFTPFFTRLRSSDEVETELVTFLTSPRLRARADDDLTIVVAAKLAVVG